ncbi:hypothetical protein [Sorangium sp. So ce887]|uniref:hypothetical protein n=1 Tax=Sorangium sp. So ce887 TaxID=3133324 RepID=UPI003F5E1F16
MSREPCRGVAGRGVAGRGVAWRAVAWRAVGEAGVDGEVWSPARTAEHRVDQDRQDVLDPIHVFPVSGRGLPSDAPVTTISRSLVPFDFSFDRCGQLIVAEVGGDGVPATDDTSAVSSYGIRADGIRATGDPTQVE